MNKLARKVGAVLMGSTVSCLVAVSVMADETAVHDNTEAVSESANATAAATYDMAGIATDEVLPEQVAAVDENTEGQTVADADGTDTVVLAADDTEDEAVEASDVAADEPVAVAEEGSAYEAAAAAAAAGEAAVSSAYAGDEEAAAAQAGEGFDTAADDHSAVPLDCGDNCGVDPADLQQYDPPPVSLKPSYVPPLPPSAE